MKIQFVNATLGGDFSAIDIAITSLATYLNERTNHSATISDLTFHRRDWKRHLAKNIESDKPDMIGISANTLYMQYIKTVVNEIKANYSIPIVLGGYHASIHPQDTMGIDGVDYVCIGDGEYVLTELLNRYSKKESMDGLAGLWAKEDGRILKNPTGSFIEDINSLPIPDYDLWKDLDKYFYFLGMIYMIGTRGCPYRCTYCDATGISDSVRGRYYREKDPRKYAQEIALQYRKYKKRGLRLAQLFDQVFTMNEKWLEEFCDEYRKEGLADKFKFSAFSRIDHINEKKAKILGKSGCALLRVGIESGDPYIRNEIYKKNISDDEIRHIFKVCKAEGIDFTAFYMLGGPAETPETLNKTIALARELDAARSAFFIYKPFTEDGFKQIVMHDGWIDKKRWEAADNITFGAVVASKKLTPRQVEYYQKKAYFWTFGKRLLRMIKRLKIRYFTRLAVYLWRGMRNGLDLSYLLIYYHIYSYDNVDK